MAQLLDQGSTSLNQRATTLAALAVAALGAFGAFATRLNEMHSHGLTIATASLLGVSSLALLSAALFALRSVRPAGKWSNNFAGWATSVVEGTIDSQGRIDHLTSTIKLQLGRNKSKANLMKHAYDGSALAVVSAGLAVLIAVLDAAIH